MTQELEAMSRLQAKRHWYDRIRQVKKILRSYVLHLRNWYRAETLHITNLTFIELLNLKKIYT